MSVVAHAGLVDHGIVVAGVVAATVWYVTASRRHGPGARRRAAWAAAASVVVVATSPPMERVAADSLTGHMVQHLALVVLAAPLFAVAAPGALVLGDLRSHGRSAPARAVRAQLSAHRSAVAAAAAATYVVVLAGTHLTGVYDAALRHRVVHDLEHLAYLLSATALWAVAGSARRERAAQWLAMAFGVIGAGALVGVVLTAAGRPLFDTYVARMGAEAALDDQRRAGALMWVGSMGVGVPLLLVTAWRWAVAEERAQRRRDELCAPTSVPR